MKNIGENKTGGGMQIDGIRSAIKEKQARIGGRGI